MTGVYGKLPSYGDFVRRGLPQSFTLPWDAWLQTCLGAASDALGADFDGVCAAAPPWRFRLPPGACGESGVAGVLISSLDSVGRLFPLTLAELLPSNATAPDEGWYAALEQAGLAGRDQGDSVDALLATLPLAATAAGFAAAEDVPAPGWWTRDGRRWPLGVLPSTEQFRNLLHGEVPVRRMLSRAMTHRGAVRSRNEDAFVDRSDIGLWAVADGAGGHGAGDIASAAAAAALADLPAGLSAAEVLSQVRQRMAGVHAELQRQAAASTKGEIPATTIVVMMARGEHFACLWAGDSRAYLLRDGRLSQMTRDHSLVQELVESGALAAELAETHPQANVITRAIGSSEALELDKVAGRVVPGDRLLLCTDGLFKALSEADIAQLLAGGGGPEALLEQALKAGARDNVTALVIEV
ncbi:MAG: type VI secretion system-associated protein TagF [Chitinophagaceae bacterium]|nr:type VI secretion system-associated protein TagF [Rubrivivax sp.]